MKSKDLFLKALFLMMCACIISCTKDFKELNQNPNQASRVAPETLLAPALYDVITTNLVRGHRINNELMQVSVFLGESREFHRYVIRPSESDAMWNGWYAQLTNFKDMYTSAKAIGDNSYMGIALILDAWTTSMITDMFGDVPYTDANRGRENILTPKFDKQQDIYADIFRKLEEANNLLALNKPLTTDQKNLDILYQGDLTKWRKFGNSIYLRLLMRVSGKPEMNAAAKIDDIVNINKLKYPIISGNSESAIIRFTGTSPLFSPFYTYRPMDFQQSLTIYFVNTLKDDLKDPRLASWATKYNNEYVGVESGYDASQVVDFKSTLPDALKNNALLGNIINYAEVQFILAEAAAKGMLTAGSAKTFYETGIANAIASWGYTVPTNYLAGAEVVWDDLNALEAKMEQIMTQKYFTLFFTDFQQWAEFRRTGHPVLPIGPGVLNDRKMPSRFVYPVIVQSVNGANYKAAVNVMGPDNINTKVWWNK
jgi:hypothetical protein